MGITCCFPGGKSAGHWSYPLIPICRSITCGTRSLHSYAFMALIRLIFLCNSRTLCSRNVSYVVLFAFLSFFMGSKHIYITVEIMDFAVMFAWTLIQTAPFHVWPSVHSTMLHWHLSNGRPCFVFWFVLSWK